MLLLLTIGQAIIIGVLALRISTVLLFLLVGDTITIGIVNDRGDDGEVEDILVSDRLAITASQLSLDSDVLPGLQLSISRNLTLNNVGLRVILQEARQTGYRNLRALSGLNRDRHRLAKLNLGIRDSVHIDVYNLVGFSDYDLSLWRIDRPIRVGDLHRNFDDVTWLGILRRLELNGAILVYGHSIGSAFSLFERRSFGSSGFFTIIIGKGRLLDVHRLARLNSRLLISRIDLAVGLFRVSYLNGRLNRLAGTVWVSHKDRHGVVTGLGICRRLHVDRTILVDGNPLWEVNLITFWVSNLAYLLKSGALWKIFISILRRSNNRLLTNRSRRVFVNWLEIAVVSNIIDCNKRILSDNYAVCIHKLCNVSTRVIEGLRRKRAFLSISQRINRAVHTNLLAVRTDPTDLVITRERQRARQLDLRRLEVVDAFRKVCRVEVGIVIPDVQISDVGLNLSEVDVVPTVTGMTRDTDITAPVRVLTRISVYLLEDGRREATEGVQDLAVVLRPDVGVILDAIADILTHTDGVAAFRIGFGTDGLEDRLLAVRAHVFDHGLGGGRLLAVRLIGDC